MLARPQLALIIYVTLGGNAFLSAGEGSAPKETVISDIVAEWKSRQQAVTSIQFTATVNRFYPKGYLSEKVHNDFPEKKVGMKTQPPKDRTYSGEPCSWTIDFSSKGILLNEHLRARGWYSRIGPRRSVAVHFLISEKPRNWRS